jgi:hypothetical protein
MPGEKGITLIQRVRQGKTKEKRFTSITMAYASGDEKVISAVRNAGVLECVLQPFNVVTLIKQIMLTFKIPAILLLRWDMPDRTGDGERSLIRTANQRVTHPPAKHRFRPGSASWKYGSSPSHLIEINDRTDPWMISLPPPRQTPYGVAPTSRPRAM